MRLKIMTAVVALVVCSAAHAKCMRETLEDTICGQGPCWNDRVGRYFARPNATELRCGTGRVRLSADLAVASKTSSPDKYCVRGNLGEMP